MALNSASKQTKLLASEVESKERELERLRELLHTKEATVNSSVLDLAVRIRNLQNNDEGENNGLDAIFIDDNNQIWEIRNNLNDLSLRIRFLYTYEVTERLTAEYEQLINQHA